MGSTAGFRFGLFYVATRLAKSSSLLFSSPLKRLLHPFYSHFTFTCLKPYYTTLILLFSPILNLHLQFLSISQYIHSLLILSLGRMESSFIEWKEQYISKEKGNRIVHYFLKDTSGDYILAVVGSETSVRHMLYVLSDDFLNLHGSCFSTYRWRSRRQVVNWLTSMLSNHQRIPEVNPMNELSSEQINLPSYKGRLAWNSDEHNSDIVWSGIAWTCGKQLKHYPAFCRTGITIAIHSFVFVMAEEDNNHLAYVEDMYEDRKCQKKVKVRWFHHNEEVQGLVSLRNPHPKEVFITPYTQVISVECIDGPAMVLTRKHYDKCLAIFPHNLLGRVHLCFRQFKSNHLKPFKLSKLLGYFDQPIFTCLDPDFDGEFSPKYKVKIGAKRSRGSHTIPYEPSSQKLKYKANEKIELLCQDSGIRGCWFRCTILEVSKRLLRVRYDDLKDENGFGNLEEWVPSCRLAMADKLGMRCNGRPTIRPQSATLEKKEKNKVGFEIGSAVDAWWSDGWWEGVVIAIANSEKDDFQIYAPSENLVLNVHARELRVSRDWVGNQWVDIKQNRNILLGLSTPEKGEEVKGDIERRGILV